MWIHFNPENAVILEEKICFLVFQAVTIDNNSWGFFLPAVDDSIELELSGINIWSRALSAVEVPDVGSSCRPSSLPADVFAWGQVLTTPNSGVTHTLRAPSECDGKHGARVH